MIWKDFELIESGRFEIRHILRSPAKMVLHNPNNWHWVNKDVSEWAKEYLEKNLIDISAEEGHVSAKVSRLVSMDGDVDVSQRKGKVITLFDVVLKLEYEGIAGVFVSLPRRLISDRNDQRHRRRQRQRIHYDPGGRA